MYNKCIYITEKIINYLCALKKNSQVNLFIPQKPTTIFMCIKKVHNIKRNNKFLYWIKNMHFLCLPSFVSVYTSRIIVFCWMMKRKQTKQKLLSVIHFLLLYTGTIDGFSWAKIVFSLGHLDYRGKINMILYDKLYFPFKNSTGLEDLKNDVLEIKFTLNFIKYLGYSSS